jgi:excisionase family DNA binding protein
LNEEDSVTPLLTIAEAAELLNVPQSWLRERAATHAVPHTRLGRHVRFTDEHLAAIIADGETRPDLPTRPLPSQLGRLRRRSASTIRRAGPTHAAGG